jgi:hypothetical protein
MTEPEDKKQKAKQVFITHNERHQLKMLLAERDIKQKDFCSEMISHFSSIQDEIQEAPEFVYPESISRNDPDCLALTMRVTDEEADLLGATVQKAKIVDEGMTERRMLRVMFKEYLQVMSR